jgi:hypothetical protein
MKVLELMTSDGRTVERGAGLTIDKDLKQQVVHALDWEPNVDAKDIGVSVDEGVVILRGNVGSYEERIAAERAALRVYGVKAVAWSSGRRVARVNGELINVPADTAG